MEWLIVANPCELPREALPKKRDKDPLWRSSAHFSREEVEQLISDNRIPWDRPMINGLLFLAGVRWGEMAALRWREYETQFRNHLGRLVIARSFDHRKRRIKPVKTEVPRWVPVHPMLAKMLAEWKVGGWAQLVGRAPTPEDFIVPNAPTLLHSSGIALAKELQNAERARVAKLKPDDIAHCRMPQLGLRRSREDCKLLGLRERRNHDARRTMISLARAGGASKDLLEWVTQGPPGDVIDGYTTLPWETLCQQVLCIKVERREGKILAMPTAASAAPSRRAVIDLAPRSAPAHSFAHRSSELLEVATEAQWGVQDSETSEDLRSAAASSAGDRLTAGIDASPAQSLAAACAAFLSTCARKSTGVDDVLATLVRACVGWTERPDGRELRRKLLELLTLLEMK